MSIKINDLTVTFKNKVTAINHANQNRSFFHSRSGGSGSGLQPACGDEKGTIPICRKHERIDPDGQRTRLDMSAPR